ncbi:MAG: zeta toxin family protein, partial [Rickettsiales bacterium]|nr:zeta toxin family protein [Rickettsiales bacterium]
MPEDTPLTPAAGAPASTTTPNADAPAGTGALDRAYYLERALQNLSVLSRTATGKIDTTGSKDKDKVMQASSGDEAARLAKRNFTDAINTLYDNKNRKFKTPEELREFVEKLAGTINKDITKEGTLIRTTDSAKYAYTPAAKLEEAQKAFYAEFLERLNDPVKYPPAETAAWVEFKVNLVDHYFADGCGKTSQALSAFVNMRDGKALPVFTTRDDYFTAVRQMEAVPPDQQFAKWQEYYKTKYTANQPSAPVVTPQLDPWRVPSFGIGINPRETLFQNSEKSLPEMLKEKNAKKIGRNDVTLKPERLLFHEVIVDLSTKVKFKDEKELKAAVEKIVASPEYQKALEGITKENSTTRGAELTERFIAAQGLERLQTYAAAERKVMFLMGGSGTGKGTLSMQMEAGGVDPGVAADADVYKFLLADPKKLGLEFSNLTQQEASLLVDKVRARLTTMMVEQGKAPNVIIDKTLAKPGDIEALKKYAGTVEIHCSFCPVDVAVERAGERGHRTGRYVTTTDLLEIHQEVAQGVPALLKEQGVAMVMYDTNTPKDVPPRIMLEKKAGSLQVNVYDLKALGTLLNQQNVNNKAVNAGELYPNGNKP